MLNLINKICLPVALLGAINYGLIGLFNFDLLSYLDGRTLVQIAQIVVGVAGAVVFAGLITNK